MVSASRTAVSFWLFLNFLQMQSASFCIGSLSFNYGSAAQSCPTLCNPVDCSTRLPCSLPSLRVCSNLTSMESVMPSNHLVPCCPLLLLPSIFPSIRVFSSEFVLSIRWPKYWSFSFRISPSSEYLGLISFKIDWFDLTVQQQYICKTHPWFYVGIQLVHFDCCGVFLCMNVNIVYFIYTLYFDEYIRCFQF